MTVLSLFDGMSCGQIALNRISKKPTKYYASEVDKYAITVTMANYPNTIQLGDVRFVDVSKLDKIDLLIGGSPCQSFSFAGKRKGMSTKDNIEILTLEHYLELKSQNFEFEGQSYLFWEYMRILTEIRQINPDVKFLLENVIMGEKWQKVLTQAIGINPIRINAALVSAQNRDRLFWSNIGTESDGLFGDLVCKIPQPKDRWILLKDILEPEVNEKYYLSDKMINYFNNRASNFNNGKINIRKNEDKATTLTASMSSCDISDNFIVAMRGRNPENPKSRESGLPTEQMLEPRYDGKTNCITTVQKDNLVFGGDYRRDEGFRWRESGKSGTLLAQARQDGTAGQALANIKGIIRRLTPLECERLQCVDDNYTNHISDTQRYKMLGNGWNVEVIAHIFNYL